MKILVTGGAGFIGSHVVEAYRAAGHEVAVIDNLSSGKRENLPEDVRLYQGSITDEEFVCHAFAEFKPEVVNHHAAQVSVTASVNDPLVDVGRNVCGTVTILEACRTTPSVKKVIYAASGGSMYGNPDSTQLPCSEEMPASPQSPYALSKYTGEQYVWLYTRLTPLKATVLRYGNVYGPRQDAHGEAGVCAIFSCRMLDDEPVTIYGDGQHVRDYVFVGDVAAANLAALDKGDGEAINIATGKATTTREVFETMKRETGYGLDAVMADERPGEVRSIILSVAKAEKTLGWKAGVAFPEGVKKTVFWYRHAE